MISTLLVLGLLGGTAAAFAITEGLKLERSPIARTHVTKLFSPVCGCPTDRAAIAFRLRHAGTLEVTVLSGRGAPVAVLAHHYFRAGTVALRWNGRDVGGAVVADGKYRVRVHLTKRHQTITLPNTIVVDTKPPALTVTRVQPRVFSPDQDGHSDYVSVGYRLSRSARALVYVDGKLVSRGRLVRGAGKIDWFGKEAGRVLPAGFYRLTVRGEDRAGNLSAPTPPVTVRIRFVRIERPVVRVRAGKRFSVPVSTDADSVHWLLHGRQGEAAPSPLELRAPRQPGRYTLFVQTAGHADRAVIEVTKK